MTRVKTEVTSEEVEDAPDPGDMYLAPGSGDMSLTWHGAARARVVCVSHSRLRRVKTRGRAGWQAGFAGCGFVRAL